MHHLHNHPSNTAPSECRAVSDGSIIELLDPARRRYWVQRFLRSYSGPHPEISPAMYSGNNVRSFAYVVDGMEIGCLRINCKDWVYKGLNLDFGPIWQAADAYVVSKWRGRGVLRLLMQHVVDNADVHIVHVERNRALMHRDFYHSFGFNSVLQIETGDDAVMLRLASDRFAAALALHRRLSAV